MSIEFVMTQARVGSREAEDLLALTHGSAFLAVHKHKMYRYVKWHSDGKKPHIYLAQRPDGTAQWESAFGQNTGRNMAAFDACNKLNQQRRSLK